MQNNGNPLIEEVPSSFEAAGRSAHLNLWEEALPFKYFIGKAILEKNLPMIRLVVNKIGNIENEFPTFPMEIWLWLSRMTEATMMVALGLWRR